MVRVFSILTSGREFNPRLGYGAVLKLVISIHPLNGVAECECLVTGLAPVDTLINKIIINMSIMHFSALESTSFCIDNNKHANRIKTESI